MAYNRIQHLIINDTNEIRTSGAELVIACDFNNRLGSSATIFTIDGTEYARITTTRFSTAGELWVGASSNPGSAKLLVVQGSVYTSESSAGIKIDNGTGAIAMLLGVDNTNSCAYLSALYPGNTWGRELKIQPNGGSTSFGGAVTVSGSSIFNNEITIQISSSSAQLKLERTTSSAGAGWIGADSNYMFATWDSGTTKRPFRVAQAAADNTLEITSSGVSVTGSLTVSGSITSSGTGAVFLTSGATTSARYTSYLSTGASFVVGADNSAGNAIISGGSSYAGVISTQNAASVFIGVNSIKVAEFSSSSLSLSSVHHRLSTGYEVQWGSTNAKIYGSDNTYVRAAIGGTDILDITSAGVKVANGTFGINATPGTDYGFYNNANVTITGGGAGTLDATTLIAAANNAALIGFYRAGYISKSSYTGLVYYNFRIDTPTVSGTGTISEAYGIWISAMPTATTKYGIYQNGSDPNYFGGIIGIGTTPTTGYGLSISNVRSGDDGRAISMAPQFTATANGQGYYGCVISSGTSLAKSTYTSLNYFGFYAGTPSTSGTGTIIGSYQVYIAAAPSGTNTYGIYQAGSDQNYFGGGIVLGAATGGNKGVGTLNVAGDIYKNNTAYTNPDYVLEHWVTGRIEKFIDKEGAKNYDGLRPIREVETFIRRNWYLPRFGQNANHGIFSGSDAMLASLEEAYLYIIQLEKDISVLKSQVSELQNKIAA